MDCDEKGAIRARKPPDEMKTATSREKHDAERLQGDSLSQLNKEKISGFILFSLLSLITDVHTTTVIVLYSKLVVYFLFHSVGK